MGCLYQLTFQSGKSYIGITSKTLKRRLTDEAKKKIAEAGIGRVFSEQSKKKMSLSKMGHPVSDETRKKIGDANRRKR